MVTTPKTVQLWVQGSGVTDPKKSHLMVNGSGTGLGTGNRVWFYWPFASASSELGLRQPDLGNIHEQNSLVVSRRMRGRGLVRFHSPPRRRAFILRFRYLTPAMAAAAKVFFDAARSSAMRYVDHDGLTWKAYLVPESLKFSETTRAGTEDMALRIDVEAAQ